MQAQAEPVCTIRFVAVQHQAHTRTGAVGDPNILPPVVIPATQGQAAAIVREIQRGGGTNRSEPVSRSIGGTPQVQKAALSFAAGFTFALTQKFLQSGPRMGIGVLFLLSTGR